MTPKNCPACGYDFTGEPIPPESRALFGNATHFSLVVLVDYSHLGYDGAGEYMCPNCGSRWGRWSGRILKDGESEPVP
jgi:hypothetical protein